MHSTSEIPGAMAEIVNTENTRTIFHHLKECGINNFAQRLGWRQVKEVTEMPQSYRDGSVFISAKSQMPWLPD